MHNYKWHYNFHLLSYAATIIISYVLFVPLTLWATIKWTPKQHELTPQDIPDDLEPLPNTNTSLLSFICVYGYSLAIYIPISLLWTVQISMLQYLLVIVGAISSGFALVLVLRPCLTTSKHGFALTLAVVALHFLLAAGLMLYFFHDSNSEPNPTSVTIQDKLATHVADINKTVNKP